LLTVPRLIRPFGAEEVKSAQQTLWWAGELPNASYGFRVDLRHGSGDPQYSSPVLNGPPWRVELPGDKVGEWRWSVSVIRRGGTEDMVARSDEWTFYYNPFGGPPPSTSPLAPPFFSPLSTPAS
jgi:hypothetical protein